MLIRSILVEYGLPWIINRSLYTFKTFALKRIPPLEKFFERWVPVQRIDIFDFNLEAISLFLKKLPQDDKNEIISIADKAMHGIITGFSSIELNFGNPMRWNFNPITGFEYNENEKWYQIPDIDSTRGDIKVVWEASRLTHFLYFTRAYLITGDNKYYKGFSEQMKHWIVSNSYSYGVNFKCSQECSLRMINSLMAYSVFWKSGLTSQEDEDNLKRLVEMCYQKVRSNFFYAHKCIRNNHTFSELTGLIIGSWCCNEPKKIHRYYDLLNKEVDEQFEEDGGYKQYSFNYQRFTLQLIECILCINRKTGNSILGIDRILKSALLLYQCQAENGELPNYGSNDGALIFPLSSSNYRDFRPVINTVHGMITGKRLYEPGNYDEELIWFGDLYDLPPAEIQRGNAAYKDAGIFVFRHQEGLIMTILQDFKSRPSHMDQLHIDLWNRGVNVLCDSGTFSYASSLGKEMASTSGHNTLKMDGIDQMNRIGTFFLTNWTKRQNYKFGDNHFTGTMISSNGYVHTRNIDKTIDGYRICDVIKANDEPYELLFHTSCEVIPTIFGFKLLHQGSLIAELHVDECEYEIRKVERSLYYLKKEDISCISIKGQLKDKKAIHIVNIKIF